MGRPSSIDEAKAAALHAAYQRLGTVSAAAREVGVSNAAAHRFFENTPKAAAPVVATQRHVIEAAGASLFDTRQALEENYARVLRLVQQLEHGIVESKTGPDGPHEAMVSPAILISALKEVREHVQSGMKLYQLLLDVDEVRRFQQTVLEAIAEADEPTRQRIIDTLRQRRAVDLAL